MCDKCMSNKSDGPTPARPLNRYDYGIAVFGFIHNVLYVLLEFTSSIVAMMQWNSRADDFRKNWAESLSRDIESLEVDNG